MTYVRHGVNCEAVPQPSSTSATDDFGNTFLNWCADFVGHDVDCNPNGKTGCAPQDPDGLLGKWEHWNVDNTAQRPLSPYVKSSLFYLPFIPIEGETLLELTEDRLFVLFAQDLPNLRLEDNTMVMRAALESE